MNKGAVEVGDRGRFDNTILFVKKPPHFGPKATISEKERKTR